MRANHSLRAHVCAFAVSPDEARASRSVRTPPQMLTLEVRPLRAISGVHRFLLSAVCCQLLALKAGLQGLVVAATPDLSNCFYR